MRERLIELLKTPNKAAVIRKMNPQFVKEDTDKDSIVADYLLANCVVVLPCNVGDTVYTNFAMRGWYFRDKDKPYSAKVVFVGLNNSEEMGGGLFNVVYGKRNYMMQFRFSDIGKSVFLTREAAEKALKEREE